MIGFLPVANAHRVGVPLLLMHHAPERLVSIGTDNEKQGIP